MHSECHEHHMTFQSILLFGKIPNFQYSYHMVRGMLQRQLEKKTKEREDLSSLSFQSGKKPLLLHKKTLKMGKN